MAVGKGKRIGLLVPSSSSTQEQEFWSALPEGVTVHVTRLSLNSVTPDATIKIVEELEKEAKKLADAEVDVIVLATTAPSSRFGRGYDQEICKRITAASGKPATTASTAMCEAFETLGIKKIVLGASWSDEVNTWVAKFIEDNGCKVLSQTALGLVSNLEIGRLDPKTAYDMGREIDRPDADAIMLACGNWRTFEIIDKLEQVVNKPVLTTDQVSLWAALRIMGAQNPRIELGRLFRHQAASNTRHTTVN